MSYFKYPPVKPGNRYGRLIVLSEAEMKIDQRCWLTLCDCGTKRVIRQAQLKNGSTQSCGCLQKERAEGKPKTHGMSKSPEHNAWLQMKNRCYNPNARRYEHYGARGITICDKWLNSFEEFLADVGYKPSPGHSLGRINNDGNYEPGNVKWQTPKQQRLNQRRVYSAPEKLPKIKRPRGRPPKKVVEGPWKKTIKEASLQRSLKRIKED